MKNVFEKLRFRDGLMWTVSLTVSCVFEFLRRSVEAASDISEPKDDRGVKGYRGTGQKQK